MTRQGDTGKELCATHVCLGTLEPTAQSSVPEVLVIHAAVMGNATKVPQVTERAPAIRTHLAAFGMVLTVHCVQTITTGLNARMDALVLTLVWCARAMERVTPAQPPRLERVCVQWASTHPSTALDVTTPTMETRVNIRVKDTYHPAVCLAQATEIVVTAFSVMVAARVQRDGQVRRAAYNAQMVATVVETERATMELVEMEAAPAHREWLLPTAPRASLIMQEHSATYLVTPCGRLRTG